MSPVKVSLPLSDCRYWLQGFCFRGRDCRFNHPPEKKGQDARTRSIDCQYWIQGYCFHGDGCRFRHVPEKMGCSWWKANKREPIIRGTGAESPTTEKEPCSICMEVPTKYGILSDCDHAFCYDCIIQWRKTALGITSWTPSEEVNQSCPLCRSQNEFVVPSDLSPAQLSSRSSHGRAIGNEQNASRGCFSAKASALNQYFAELRTCPCPVFLTSVAESKDRGNPLLLFCWYGNRCKRLHVHPSIPGQTYTFSPDEERLMAGYVFQIWCEKTVKTYPAAEREFWQRRFRARTYDGFRESFEELQS